MQTRRQRSWRRWFRGVCWAVLVVFSGNTVFCDLREGRFAYAQEVAAIPPGTLLTASPTFSLPVLKAISIDPIDPFKINFVVDAADTLKVDEEQAKRLTQYFLTFLTIPEEDLWVNLSPHEADHIVSTDLKVTPVGRDMLTLDYLLKQLAASMTYPDKEPGATFWRRMMDKVQTQYGISLSEFAVDSFSRVWVVPERAVVYEQGGTALIAESRLKVLTEEDYWNRNKGAASKKAVPATTQQYNGLYTSIYREVIIPELEREVNEGKHFAPLRQMYHSLILATWFKRRLKEHIVNRVYADQKKISGLELEEKQVAEKIYGQYLEAMRKGVYNYIKEDYDPLTQALVPRKYFSGGFTFGNSSQWLTVSSSPVSAELKELSRKIGRSLFEFTVSLIPLGVSRNTLLSSVLASGLLAAPLPGQAHDAFSVNRSSGIPGGGQGPGYRPRRGTDFRADHQQRGPYPAFRREIFRGPEENFRPRERCAQFMGEKEHVNGPTLSI
jgi:hypothetical protein